MASANESSSITWINRSLPCVSCARRIASSSPRCDVELPSIGTRIFWYMTESFDCGWKAEYRNVGVLRLDVAQGRFQDLGKDPCRPERYAGGDDGVALCRARGRR